jgi:hypothetical protein
LDKPIQTLSLKWLNTNFSTINPIDLQVRDVTTGLWIPAHSIKEALTLYSTQLKCFFYILTLLRNSHEAMPIVGLHNECILTTFPYLQIALLKFGSFEFLLHVFDWDRQRFQPRTEEARLRHLRLFISTSSRSELCYVNSTLNHFKA